MSAAGAPDGQFAARKTLWAHDIMPLASGPPDTGCP